MRTPAEIARADESDAARRADPELLLAAIRENSFKPIVATNQTTGLQLSQLRHATQPTSGATTVAEEFLAASRLAPEDFEVPNSIRNYFNDSSQTMLAQWGKRAVRETAVVQLPPPAELSTKLRRVLESRRSRREYTGDALSLTQMGSLLWAAAGVTGEVLSELTSASVAAIPCRTAASGGGLFPVDLYVAALRVSGLPRGVYVYAPRHHQLVAMESSVDEVSEGVNLPEDQISGAQAAAVFLLGGSPWRSMRKYGARGLRYLFIEAGAMSQGLHLAAVALDVGTVDYGGFYDVKTNTALGLDGRYEAVVHTVVCGAV